MSELADYLDGEQRLPDTAPARYAFGRVVGAHALWDWDDEDIEGEIDEFRLRFYNKPGASLTVYCNHAQVAALYDECGGLLAKFAAALQKPRAVGPCGLPTGGEVA